MIISRTPFRISLFGGGSDYPHWYRQHGGSVLGFAIDKYCYISLRELPPFFEHRHRVVYSKVETVHEVNEIQHPAVRNVLLDMGIERGMEIHHDGDLPARSGLGSSSSFTVGLLNALYALSGRIISKSHLAQEAIRIEQNVIQENVGSQDQVWAAFGGFGRINFAPDESFSVLPLVMTRDRRDELLGSLMLFFTGFSRIASEVAAKKIASLDAKAAQVRQMVELVDQAVGILASQSDFDDIGRLLHQSWQLKRGLADSITNRDLDQIYDAGMAAGALGGKLLGAGGGGFMLFYVPPGRQEAVRQALPKLIEVKFGIDTAGSRIVVYEPEGLQNR
ncbi:kinase [Ferrovibrio terrae]|uniref:Kinase n=1 Tax=Ferrovibrio terrae TaxID=2594003 RepID=A0A516GXV8_9PROT|nr:kinase [Ferrovibrio terrae]QDO96332.1 kinase [Ferrovibrio terrae]